MEASVLLARLIPSTPIMMGEESKTNLEEPEDQEFENTRLY